MSRTVAFRVAAIGFLVLLALHLDFWRPQSARLLFGWLPEELAYRIGTILLAWIYILWICSRVWREESD